MRDHTDVNANDSIVLVGSPNSGKTTLYNWLTHSNYKTVNYPGATTEYAMGKLAANYFSANSKREKTWVIDTPGIYSLIPKSADEEVTFNVLYKHPTLGFAKKIILVVDGTQLERHLLIARQLKEAGFSFVIALTMSDLLKKNSVKINTQLLEKEFHVRVVSIDGILGGGINNLIEEIESISCSESTPQAITWSKEDFNQRQKQTTLLAKRAVEGSQQNLSNIFTQTLVVDRWLMHPFWGIVFFFIIMWGLFSSIYWGAIPLMDLVDTAFKLVIESVHNLAPHSLWADFIADGILASFNAIFIFLPQIFILFLGIGLLESTGYLARAATLIDRPFSTLGLSGRSFVPLLSGFACAVPAIMATRNISSPRDRLITNFVIPLMSCSARLPVYALFLTFLFVKEAAWKAGLMLAVLYIGSLVLGGIAAMILNRILKKNKRSFFMMELPMYRKPVWKILFKQTFNRTKAYLVKAGPIIFIFAILIWTTCTFPNYQMNGEQRLQSSYLAQAGRMAEPIFTPMGVDWRVGVGLMSAFAAREVFVSSLAVMFQLPDNDAKNTGLLMAMHEARMPSGEKIFTVASVTGLILFFMIALQCMSTVAIQIRENNSWKFAVAQLVIFNFVAYFLSVGVVQTLRYFGVN